MRWLWLRNVKEVINLVLYRKTYRMRMLFIGLLLASILLYVLFYRFLTDNYVIDYQYVSAVDQSVLENRVDFREVPITKVCSNMTSICYGIYDRKITQEGEKEIVERHLIIDGFFDDSDTVVRLIAPEGGNFDSSDTRIWRVDHSDVRSTYVAGMLVGPFLLSSLSLDQQDIGKKVLEIGLGGGSFNMALHMMKPDVNLTVVELDPVVVKIAVEWFGVKDSKNHRIFVNDGLEFLKNAVANGMKYDVVVLDACDQAIKSPCPAKNFRDANSLIYMKDVLTATGAFVVNILSSDREGSGSSTREIIELFTSVFPTCVQMRMSKEVNIILTCVSYSISNIREQMSFYNSRLERVMSHLKLKDVLGNAVLV